jgi:histone-lysine N-methyltransferase SETMAR
MKVHEIAETIGISKECVGYILHEELEMKKLCARWVLPLLTADQKRTCMEISEQCLENFNKNKQPSNQLTETGCSVPKKTRLVPSAGNVMASVFWDAEGILFIDYLKKGRTITREYYSNLLTRLDEKIHEKRPSLQKKKFSFNMTVHPPIK